MSSSIPHRQNYVKWREVEMRLLDNSGIDSQLNEQILSEMALWKEIRIICVILFIAERGLAFRGSSQRIESCDNGNFLGIINLLSRFDPIHSKRACN